MENLKEIFSEKFYSTLLAAQSYAEAMVERELPQAKYCLLHGAGYDGVEMDVESCLEKIFINEEQFFKIIDVSIIGYDDLKVLFFVRVSGHMPVPYSETLNGYPGGPFKFLEPATIRQL